MNLFDNKLLTDTFKTLTQPIIMNPDSDESYTINSFISNATFSANSSYHIHSTNEFSCGDYFQLNDEYYLITGDVVTTRGIKYKSVADYCNIMIPITETEQVIIGYNDLGKPIFEDIITIVGYNFGVIRHRTMSVEGSSLLVPTTELILTIRDNESNRNTYATNFEIEFEGVNWKVVERDFTKKGIIKLRLQTA